MEIKNLLDNNNFIIALDTNVLLSIYRCSPDFSEFSLSCLKKVITNVYLPATVHLEYRKHYRSEFSKLEKRFSLAGEETKKQIDLAKNKILHSCSILEHLHFPDVDELRSELTTKIDAVNAALSNYYDERRSLVLAQHFWDGKDFVEDLVNEINNNGHVFPCLTQEEIYLWCEEGQKRYAKEVPPGFKDAKVKDGVSKYSDLLIWKEILKYVKENNINVIFVTDDVKQDWWETIDNKRQFHSRLFNEFNKTGQQLYAFEAKDFYEKISEEYGITKTDTVELALQMTDEDYYRKIHENVFAEVEDSLIFDSMDYINEASANIGTEGIDEFNIIAHEFINAERIERNENNVVYDFVYYVTLTGTSYDYLGKDKETNKFFLSDGREHTFEGEVVVRVDREASPFIDFTDDDVFESATVVDGNLEETAFSDLPGELGYCPACGRPLNTDNDAGGYCFDCAPDF